MHTVTADKDHKENETTNLTCLPLQTTWQFFLYSVKFVSLQIQGHACEMRGYINFIKPVLVN